MGLKPYQKFGRVWIKLFGNDKKTEESKNQKEITFDEAKTMLQSLKTLIVSKQIKGINQKAGFWIINNLSHEQTDQNYQMFKNLVNGRSPSGWPWGQINNQQTHETFVLKGRCVFVNLQNQNNFKFDNINLEFGKFDKNNSELFISHRNLVKAESQSLKQLTSNNGNRIFWGSYFQ